MSGETETVIQKEKNVKELKEVFEKNPAVKGTGKGAKVVEELAAAKEAAGKGQTTVVNVPAGENVGENVVAGTETGKGATVLPVALGATETVAEKEAVKSENDNKKIIDHLITLPAYQVGEKITDKNYKDVLKPLQSFFANPIITQYETVKTIQSVIISNYSLDNMKKLNTALGDFRAEMNALK